LTLRPSGGAAALPEATHISPLRGLPSPSSTPCVQPKDKGHDQLVKGGLLGSEELLANKIYSLCNRFLISLLVDDAQDMTNEYGGSKADLPTQNCIQCPIEKHRVILLSTLFINTTRILFILNFLGAE
jgi:hypothetical protein